jgi:hypothetical protein
MVVYNFAKGSFKCYPVSMPKVISINSLAVIKKNLSLSIYMIKTLVSACDKQSKKEAFGPKDIKGSFLPLTN